DTKKMTEQRTQLFSDNRIERVSVPGQNGITLDGALFKSEQPAKGVIFFVLGSGGYYEKIADQNDLAHELVNFFKSHVGKDVDILVVNPRGIGESKGTPSYEGWVSDMHAGIKYLLDKGCDAKNLLVYGHSFGGWIAVDAVKNHNQKMPIA